MSKPKRARQKRFGDVFSMLPVKENPKVSSFDGVPCVLHEDHRWLLPIAFAAQQNGLLPKPCTIVMFDLHHDAVTPDCQPALQDLAQRLDLSGLAELCATHLRKLDDDWLKAGMELGIFDNAVVFGTEHNPSASISDREVGGYQDHHGNNHLVRLVYLPNSSLGYQGELSDLAKSGLLEELWTVLGWRISGRRFEFDFGAPRILLSIDLDCFAVQWSDYNFPWPDEVFRNEFLVPSSYPLTEGWTGGQFLRGLAKKSGLISIARETECTNGSEKAKAIWDQLNRYGFDSQIQFESFT